MSPTWTRRPPALRRSSERSSSKRSRVALSSPFEAGPCACCLRQSPLRGEKPSEPSRSRPCPTWRFAQAGPRALVPRRGLGHVAVFGVRSGGAACSNHSRDHSRSDSRSPHRGQYGSTPREAPCFRKPNRCRLARHVLPRNRGRHDAGRTRAHSLRRLRRRLGRRCHGRAHPRASGPPQNRSRERIPRVGRSVTPRDAQPPGT